VSRAGRVPRRYRGRDIYVWLQLTGFLDWTADKLPSTRARFAANPHVSGRDGGRSLNLHQFARDGVVLLGHVEAARGGRVRLAADLPSSLATADAFETEILSGIDVYIARLGLDAPREEMPRLDDAYRAPAITELDLASAGVSTVIWATGYGFDFRWVRVPVLDGDGYPVQRQGKTAFPGLHFVGLPWLDKRKSGQILGVGEDAALVASIVAGRHGGG
jgi:putative flavoprotein involved in K+ transport